MNLKSQVGFFANPRLLLFALLMTVISCEKDDTLAPNNTSKLEKHLQYLVATGFHRDEIIFDSNRDEFIMHGDMVLSRTEVEAYMKRDEGTPLSKVQQRPATLTL